MENVPSFYHLVLQVVTKRQPLNSHFIHLSYLSFILLFHFSFSFFLFFSVMLIFINKFIITFRPVATFCEMDGAQDVILNLDDKEADEKNALRICNDCHNLLTT